MRVRSKQWSGWIVGVLLVALLESSSGAVAEQKADPPVTSPPAEVSPAVSAVADAFTQDSQAYDLLTELTTSIGQRLTATKHGAAAEKFVYDKLKKFGYDPQYESFPIRSWTRGTLDLDVDGKRIAAAAFVDTPARADVATELIDVGNGTAVDYADPDRIRGKIALVYTTVLPGSPADTPKVRRSAKLALAVAHGAAGVIFINQRPGDNVVTGSAGRNGAAGADAELVTVPVLSVGHDTGLQLEDALAKHTVHARIRMTNAVAPGSARNVVATLEGSEFPEEYIVLGGHLDCLDLATGAVDDGTGAMWVLDVARGLKAHHFKPRRSIRFIFFMGEEQGMVGSYAYVNRAERNGTLGKIKYMVNTDMSVNPTGYNLWSGDPDLRFFDALAGTVRKYYPSFVTGASTGNANGSQSSDSQPFIERGIPIAYPTPTWAEDMLRCVHADCDTMKWVTREDLRRSAGMGAMLVTALADSAHSVARVFSVSQTQTYLSSAAAPAAEQPDKFAWLEGQYDPAAVAWAKERTSQAFAELRAKPVAAAVERELRDALKSSAPPAQYALLGNRVVRFERDELHPLGLLQTAPRGADGGVGGTWRTVLDVGALDEKEGKNYQLMGMEFGSMCLPPAFERCLVPLSPGASENKEFREFDLVRGTFVEDGFKVHLNRTRVVWLDADTLLISVPDNLDGKPVLHSHLPGVVRLWKRGTPFAQSKVIFQALPDDSSVHVRAVGVGAERKGVVMQAKDYLTFVQYLVGPQGNLIPTNLPTRLKSFALTTPTARHLVMQLAEAATVQGKTYPAESVLAYDASAGIPDGQRLSLVITPPPGTYLNDPIDGLTGGRTRISMVLDHNLTKTLVTAEPGATGWSIHKMMSAPAGVRMLLSSDPVSDDLLVRTEGFLQPVTVSVVRTGKAPVQIEADALLIDASRYVSEIRSARSKDGTRVDYYLVRPKEPAPGPVPTIIYGYGGFGVNADPNYFGTGLGRTRRSWLMRGGAFVVAAIRGGGERGSSWYAAGRGRNKQNSFDDFAAVARDLVKSGFTVPAKIGIHGHSNGGLLTSVEVTEHPELFGAALIGAPVTDVPGFFKGAWGIGAGMAKELGDPNDPAELAGMLHYSPYQNVRAGVKYPRILITTSTEDNQVGAGQARRFAAKLEEAGAHPLLIEGPTGGHPFPSEFMNTDVAALQMTFLIDALMK